MRHTTFWTDGHHEQCIPLWPVACTVGPESGDLLSHTDYTYLQQNFSQHNPSSTEGGVHYADIHMLQSVTKQLGQLLCADTNAETKDLTFTALW
jgi:hypothetical protein